VTSADPEPERALQGERVSRLKEQIERRKYRVDPEAVAQEILFKLRMIHLGRRGMLGARSSDAHPDAGEAPQGR
jgi:hypothetical protein